MKIKGSLLQLKGRPMVAGVVALAIAGLGAGVAVAAVSGPAATGGGGPVPPWESAISPAPNGFITFYNAQGQVVTGGGFINSTSATITSSVAHAGGVSWDVNFTGNTGTVTVQAICAVGTETP